MTIMMNFNLNYINVLYHTYKNNMKIKNQKLPQGRGSEEYHGWDFLWKN
jgi:hypothetical protein